MFGPLARSPFIHFLLLGGLLYGGKAVVPEAWLQKPPPIAISAMDIERLRDEWLRDSGREPSDWELKASLNRFLDEEVLIRESLRLGFDRRDAVVRRRLLMNMRFAFPESELDDENLLHEARRLQMAARDPVTRRRMIQLMEQRLAGQVVLDEEDVRDYLARHPERFTQAPRRAFRQIFFSADRHRSNEEIRSLLLQLRQRPDLQSLGDSFLLGSDFPLRSADEIAAGFGTEFAAAVMRAPIQEWVGPVRSPYGLHLIRIDASEVAQPAPLAAVRTRAGYALIHQREQESLQMSLAKLRRRYPVRMPSALETSWP